MGDDGDGDGGGGRSFPGHPDPIPNAPRDNIFRKGIPSLRFLHILTEIPSLLNLTKKAT